MWNRMEESDGLLSKVDRRLQFVEKGKYVVVEGSAALESLFLEEIESNQGSWTQFKSRAPTALAKELAAHLDLDVDGVDLAVADWNEVVETTPVKKLDQRAVKQLYVSLSASRVLINIQPQYTNVQPDGQDGGGRGRGRGRGKGKGKGKGKAQRERKTETFVLELAFGLPMLKLKEQLDERLEQRLRRRCGLPAGTDPADDPANPMPPVNPGGVTRMKQDKRACPRRWAGVLGSGWGSSGALVQGELYEPRIFSAKRPSEGEYRALRLEERCLVGWAAAGVWGVGGLPPPRHARKKGRAGGKGRNEPCG